MALLLAARASAEPAPPNHVNITPQALENLRVAGQRVIEPDASTKHQIEADHVRIVYVSFVACIDTTGAIASTELLSSSRYPDWDDKVRTTMLKTWRYRAYEVKGKPTPACTALTQTYKNPNAPPPKPSGKTA